jgi:hypothetical protein
MNILVCALLYIIGIPIAVIVISDVYQLTGREAGLLYAVLILLLVVITANDKDCSYR